MKKIFTLIILFSSLSFIGCVPPKMYSWGNYSNTLYAYKKNTNDETLLTHMKELETIIENSKQNNLRVPPGIYGELGYFYFKSNKSKEAIECFNLEKQLYPESSILMDRLIQKANITNNLSSSK